MFKSKKKMDKKDDGKKSLNLDSSSSGKKLSQ
jgi:hypothetical protein